MNQFAGPARPPIPAATQSGLRLVARPRNAGRRPRPHPASSRHTAVRSRARLTIETPGGAGGRRRATHSGSDEYHA